MQTTGKKSGSGLKKAPRRLLVSDDPRQSKAVIKKAREIAADERHSAADKLLGQMASR